MQHTSFSELRSHAREYFDLVEAGETVRVTRNGKPIADIVPIPADLPSWKKRTAQPLVIDSASLGSLILAERDASGK